jgi:hypothetical protein
MTKAEMQAEIERLKDKCDKQAMMLRRLFPDRHADTYFIHCGYGEEDRNGLPQYLMIVPAFGCDWSQIYERSDRQEGPEW